MARREYGSGSVFQRNDGTWVGRAEAGWTTSGARRRVQVQGKTEAEAKRKLRAKLLALRAGETTTTRATVKSWSVEWLERRRRQVRPNTYANDAGAVNRWIVPTIGRRRLDQLTPGDMHAVEKAVRDAGRSSTTARTYLDILRRMLQAARRAGHVVPEAVLLVESPKRAVHDRDAIPVDQARTLLLHAAESGHGARVALALLQGLRQGEALGLTWDRVDLESGIIDVAWQLESLPYADRSRGTFAIPDGYEAVQLHRGYHLTRPKSSAGRRIMPMTAPTAAALRELRASWEPNPWGLLFTGQDTRYGREQVTPASERADRDVWRRLQDEAQIAHPAGRPWFLHEARHTTASLLLSAGVDPAVISMIIGHSSWASTRAYAHVGQDAARHALDAAAGLLGLEG